MTPRPTIQSLRSALPSLLSVLFILLTQNAAAFSTGVGNNYLPLSPSSVDPHYVILSGPDGSPTDAVVINPAGSPIGTAWIPNSATASWIGSSVSGNGAPGDYVYRLAFNLGSLDPGDAIYTGEWAADNNGIDIRINGVSTGNATALNFSGLTPFRIDHGFVAGVNTLDFVVRNDTPGVNPTGLFVSRAFLSSKTTVARGLYNTGVDDNGVALPAGEEDPHYYHGSGATWRAALSNGAWLANSPDNTWLNPDGNGTTSDAVGTSVLHLPFDLKGPVAETFVLSGQWLADNEAEILLNGEATGLTLFPTVFTTFVPFQINGGFVEGRNVLSFRVINAPSAGVGANPTGLRVVFHHPALPLSNGAALVLDELMDPRRTFLRVRADPQAQPPRVVNLAEIGVRAGDRLVLEQSGDFTFTGSGDEAGTGLIGCFSSSDVVEDSPGDTPPFRIPGRLLSAAANYVTANTIRGPDDEGFPTDFPEDFDARLLVVTVPESATHLILGAYDVYFGDNRDFDDNFRIRIYHVPDPLADSDGDATPDLDELVFGTDPFVRDLGPPLRLQAVPPGFLLQWTTNPGRLVILEGSGDLQTWHELTRVSRPVLQVTSEWQIVQNPVYRFFRLSVQ